jgi:D-alanyl-D-alanine carboxypeptidase
MNPTEAAEQITTRLRKRVSSDPRIYNAYLLVHSDRSGFHVNLAEGETWNGLGSKIQSHQDQPVYMASAGKLFTAVLLAILYEQGNLSFEGPLADFLDSDLLDGLHVFKGRDYTRQIRLKHLLNHTSGLHDYFENPRKVPFLPVSL